MNRDDEDSIHRLMRGLCKVMQIHNPVPADSITAITGVLVLALTQIPEDAQQKVLDSVFKSIKEGVKVAAIAREARKEQHASKESTKGTKGGTDKGDH